MSSTHCPVELVGCGSTPALSPNSNNNLYNVHLWTLTLSLMSSFSFLISSLVRSSRSAVSLRSFANFSSSAVSWCCKLLVYVIIITLQYNHWNYSKLTSRVILLWSSIRVNVSFSKELFSDSSWALKLRHSSRVFSKILIIWQSTLMYLCTVPANLLVLSRSRHVRSSSFSLLSSCSWVCCNLLSNRKCVSSSSASLQLSPHQKLRPILVDFLPLL